MTFVRLLLFGMSVALAGCVASPPAGQRSYIAHTLTREEARQVEAHVLRRLRATDALFSSLKAARSTSGPIVVCGWVRVRWDVDEYARYPDNRPFVVSYVPGPERLQEFRMLYFADVKSEAAPLYTYCAQRGISL